MKIQNNKKKGLYSLLYENLIVLYSYTNYVHL